MWRLLFRLSVFHREQQMGGRGAAGGRGATFYGLLEFFFHYGLERGLALALAMALLSFISSGEPNGPTGHHLPPPPPLPLTDSRKKRSISLYYVGHHLRGEYNARRRTDEGARQSGTDERRTSLPSRTVWTSGRTRTRRAGRHSPA